MILGSQYFNETAAALSPTGTDLPSGLVGTLMDWAGTAAPSKWVFCFGQSLLRAGFPALFTAIGTTYGAADGTHFNVPDLRGRVSAGKDNMGGVSADRLTELAQGVDGDTLGASGGEQAHLLTGNVSFGSSGEQGQAELVAGNEIVSASPTGNYAQGIQVHDADTAHNNVQPTIILNKIIYTGV